MGSSRPYHKVVITGLGVVTSLGHDIETFWANLIAGQSGIQRVTRFDITDYPCQVGAEVRDFDPTTVMGAKEVRRNDRFTHFALAATKSALHNGCVDVGKLDSFRIGVLLGVWNWRNGDDRESVRASPIHGAQESIAFYNPFPHRQHGIGSGCN